MRIESRFAMTLFVMSCAPAPMTTPSVAPTRTPDECRALVGQVRAHPDSFHGTVPQATQIVVPPNILISQGNEPIEIVVRMLVDETGAVVRDSIRIEPSADRINDPFALKGAIARYRFRPSVLDSCAVPAWTKMTFRAGP